MTKKKNVGNTKEISMPKISVIVPIYNAEKYLEQCLSSIQAQSLEDIEIICVDDGSTDRSPEIIDRYVQKDNRFVAIHKSNSGNGHSMNQGIKKATGEYIGCVEADDYIETNMFEKLYMYGNSGEIDIVKGNFFNCYEKGNGEVERVINQERSYMSNVVVPFTIRQYPQFLFGHPSIWSAIYKRELIEKNNISFVEEKGGGWVDNPFFHEVMCCANSIVWVNRPLYNYRTEVEGSSSKEYDFNIPFNRMKDNLNVLEKHGYGDEEILKSAYARAIMYLCGAETESDYDGREEEFYEKAKEMLDRINPVVIRDDFNAHDKKMFLKYESPLNNAYRKRKVLIYNWIPFDNPQGNGGGVTVYCRNLIQSIISNRPDIEVYFLSSGWAYDISKKACYIRKINNIFGTRCKSYEVVNSPVPAPQDMLFGNPSVAFENMILKDTIDNFLQKHGPFSVIHFNNLEGLSFDVFQLKEKYEETKFIYSLHNYVPFCMTGFYFDRNKHHVCRPDCSESDCDLCIDRVNMRNYEKEMIERGCVNSHVEYSDKWKYEWSDELGFDRLNIIKKPVDFISFKTKASNMLNQYMDEILAVSKCVYNIAVDNGIKQSKLVLSYIGTRVADFQIRKSNCDVKGKFKICYLGSNLDYEEKGYPFLLDSLEKMEAKYASNVDLVLTTITDGKDDYIREKLKNFNKVQIIHGYTHADLHKILSGVNLGIIPVLWEDNLPQIAIEMVAFGVPILSSSAGGASELTTAEEFRFKVGDSNSLVKKLCAILDDNELLDKFWKGHTELCTNQNHYNQIEKIYNLENPQNIVFTSKDINKIVEEREFLYKHFVEENVDHYRYGIDQLKSEVDQLKSEIEIITKERNELRWHLEETWKSKSFKIARFITAIPRRIRYGKKET